MNCSDHRQSEIKPRALKNSPRVLVIGGGGAMGQLFVDLFIGLGATVEVLEKNDPILESRLAQFNIILLAVPMHLAVSVAKEVSPLVPKSSLLLDINSLKEEICAVFKQYCQGEILGTHPMFGPTVSSVKGQKIVITPIRSGPWSEWVLDSFVSLGVNLVKVDPVTHDRMMAIVQVLNHFSTMVMGEALRRANVPIRETLGFTSPIYLIELATVGRLFAQDSDLYHEISTANPRAAEMREIFLEAANELNGILSTQERHAFSQRFNEIHDFFGDFSREAMLISNRLIGLLAELPGNIPSSEK